MAQKTRSLLTWLLTIVLAAVMTLGVGFMVGCGGDDSSEDVTITLSKTEAEVVVGDTTRIIATVTGEGTVTWSSSNESVATVSSNGQVTGVSAGTATITAAIGGVSAACTVTVTEVTLTLSNTSVSIEKGETYQLSVTASDTTYAINWTSSDDSIASVDSTGLVTAIKKGDVTITATYGTTSFSTSCAVSVVWTNEPEGYTEIINGGETDTFSTYPDQWVYWNDQGWCGTEVTAIEAYTAADGSATFIYSGCAEACYYGYQIFYTNTSLVGGTYYKITLVLNSAVAGQITVSGNVIDLEVGDNTVVIYRTEPTDRTTYGDASIGFQMGVDSGDGATGTVIESNTFVIKSITWEEEQQTALDAVTGVAITSAGVVTFTDGNAEGTTSYLLTFYQNGTQVATQTVENGGTIDQASLDNGEYTVTVTAVGGGTYTNSDESEAVSFTVTEGKVYLEAVTNVAIASNVVTFTDGNSAGVDSYILTLYLQGYPVYSQTITNGGTVTVGAIENASYTATITAVGSGRYVTSDESAAIDYVVTDGTAASGYSFKTVGLKVEGDSLYYVIVGTYSTSTYTADQIIAYKDTMLFALRGNPYATTGLWDGDWTFYTFADSTTITAADGVFTISFDITSLINKTYTYTSYLSFDGTHNGAAATYEEGNITDFTVGIDYSYSVEFNGYTVTVSSDSSDTGDGFKFWGLVGLTVKSNSAEESSDSGSASTTAGTLINGGESDATSAPGTMVYWYVADAGWSCGPVVTMTEATAEEHTVTLTYTAPDDAYWFAVQYFYALTDAEMANASSVSLTITSAVAGDITINGTVYTLEAGVAQTITLDLSGTGEISIQFGNDSAGTFITGTNTVTITCDLFEVVESSGEAASTVGTLINGGESEATAAPGTYVYWNDQWWCGSNITINSATLENGVVTIDYTAEGTCWYGLQFFYEFTDEEKAAGATNVTLTISSTTAGDVTINGTVYTLEAGVAQTVTVASASGSDLSIQMGNASADTMLASSVITISDISCS